MNKNVGDMSLFEAYAEIDILREQIGSIHVREAYYKEEIDRLRAALKPFVLYAENEAYKEKNFHEIMTDLNPAFKEACRVFYKSFWSD